MLSRYYPWMQGQWETSSFGLSENLSRAVQMLTDSEQEQLRLGSNRITDLGRWKRYELAHRAPRIDCVFLCAVKVPILGPRHPDYIPELGGGQGYCPAPEGPGKGGSGRNFNFARRCTHL